MVASGTLIYLLRHGEVVLAETRRFIGHLDVPLSPTGERQSAAQAGRLATVKLAALYSSDLTRARRTGEIIGAPHALSPAIVPALREMAMGRWEGLTAAEIQRAEPEKFAEWIAFESLAGAHPGEAIAIVAHGGTNRALLCRALGLPPGRLLSMGQDYGALTVLERIDATWRLIHLNERPVL